MNISFVGISELEKFMNNPQAQFIDLREVQEYNKQHIRGAISIPYEVFPEKLKELSIRKVYILYCERGATSIMAASLMLKNGFKCYSLSGGIEAFND